MIIGIKLRNEIVLLSSPDNIAGTVNPYKNIDYKKKKKNYIGFTCYYAVINNCYRFAAIGR